MGQKINPLSLRLQTTNRHFDSSWYSDINYNHFLSQDLTIRKYLNSILKQIGFSQGQYSIINSPKKSTINFCFLNLKEARSLYLAKFFGMDMEKKIMRVKRKQKKRKVARRKVLISSQFKKKFVIKKQININFLNCFKKVEFPKKQGNTSFFFSNWFFFQKDTKRKGPSSEKKNPFLYKKKYYFSTKGVVPNREITKNTFQSKHKIKFLKNTFQTLTFQPKKGNSIVVDNPQNFGQIDLFNEKKEKTKIGVFTNNEEIDFFYKKKKRKKISVLKRLQKKCRTREQTLFGTSFAENKNVVFGSSFGAAPSSFFFKAKKKKNATVNKNYKKKNIEKKTKIVGKKSTGHFFCQQFSREKAQFNSSKKLNYLTHLLLASRWISSHSTLPLNKKKGRHVLKINKNLGSVRPFFKNLIFNKKNYTDYKNRKFGRGCFSKKPTLNIFYCWKQASPFFYKKKKNFTDTKKQKEVFDQLYPKKQIDIKKKVDESLLKKKKSHLSMDARTFKTKGFVKQTFFVQRSLCESASTFFQNKVLNPYKKYTRTKKQTLFVPSSFCFFLQKKIQCSLPKKQSFFIQTSTFMKSQSKSSNSPKLQSGKPKKQSFIQKKGLKPTTFRKSLPTFQKKNNLKKESDSIKYNLSFSSSVFFSFLSASSRKIKGFNTNKKTLLRKIVFLRFFLLIAFFINLQGDNRKIQNLLQKATRFLVLKDKKEFSLVAKFVNINFNKIEGEQKSNPSLYVKDFLQFRGKNTNSDQKEKNYSFRGRLKKNHGFYIPKKIVLGQKKKN